MAYPPALPRREDVSLFDYITKRFSAGTANIGSALAGFGEGAAETIGATRAQDFFGDAQFALQENAERLNREAGEYQTLYQGDNSIAAKAGRGELTPVDVGRGLSDLAFSQAPQLIFGSTGAKALGPLASPLFKKWLPKTIDGARKAAYAGGVVGASAATGAQLTGSIYNDQEEKDFGQALAYGMPAGALEAAGMMYGINKAGLGGYLAKELAPTAVRSAKQIGVDILKAGAVGGMTEGSQSVLEQFGAMKEFDPSKIDPEEVIENLLAGVVFEGGLTAVGAPITQRKAKIQETKERIEKEIEEEIAALEAKRAMEEEEEVVAGVAPTSILGGAPTADEIQRAASSEEVLSTATDAANESISAVEEASNYLQDAIETLPEEQALADEIGADPVEVTRTTRSLFTEAKGSFEYFAQKVREVFGKTRDYALRLWNSLKAAYTSVPVNKKETLGNTEGQRGSWSTRTKPKFLQMKDENIEKIKAGEKTLTTRTYPLKKGAYELKDGTIVEVLEDTFPVYARQVTDIEKYAQKEGFASAAEMREKTEFQHIRDFLDNKKPLHIAKLRVVGKDAKGYANESNNRGVGENRPAEGIVPGQQQYTTDTALGSGLLDENGALGQELRGQPQAEVLGANKYTLHSGGALGSDTYWGEAGKAYGVEPVHYHAEGQKTPSGNKPISKEKLKTADKLLSRANKTLGRRFPTSNEYVNNLLRRNAWQVYNSDAVFAVGTLAEDMKTVSGGTGWAVQMAVDANEDGATRPIYVFDQEIQKWHQWDGEQFVETDTPTLTKNFAGIGTRELTDSGKSAIEAVFAKTFGIQGTQTEERDIDKEYENWQDELQRGMEPTYPQAEKPIDLSAEEGGETMSAEEAFGGMTSNEYIDDLTAFLNAADESYKGNEEKAKGLSERAKRYGLNNQKELKPHTIAQAERDAEAYRMIAIQEILDDVTGSELSDDEKAELFEERLKQLLYEATSGEVSTPKELEAGDVQFDGESSFLEDAGHTKRSATRKAPKSISNEEGVKNEEDNRFGWISDKPRRNTAQLIEEVKKQMLNRIDHEKPMNHPDNEYVVAFTDFMVQRLTEIGKTHNIKHVIGMVLKEEGGLRSFRQLKQMPDSLDDFISYVNQNKEEEVEPEPESKLADLIRYFKTLLDEGKMSQEALDFNARALGVVVAQPARAARFFAENNAKDENIDDIFKEEFGVRISPRVAGWLSKAAERGFFKAGPPRRTEVSKSGQYDSIRTPSDDQSLSYRFRIPLAVVEKMTLEQKQKFKNPSPVDAEALYGSFVARHNLNNEAKRHLKVFLTAMRTIAKFGRTGKLNFKTNIPHIIKIMDKEFTAAYASGEIDSKDIWRFSYNDKYALIEKLLSLTDIQTGTFDYQKYNEDAQDYFLPVAEVIEKNEEEGSMRDQDFGLEKRELGNLGEVQERPDTPSTIRTQPTKYVDIHYTDHFGNKAVAKLIPYYRVSAFKDVFSEFGEVEVRNEKTAEKAPVVKVRFLRKVEKVGKNNEVVVSYEWRYPIDMSFLDFQRMVNTFHPSLHEYFEFQGFYLKDAKGKLFVSKTRPQVIPGKINKDATIAKPRDFKQGSILQRTDNLNDNKKLLEFARTFDDALSLSDRPSRIKQSIRETERLIAKAEFYPGFAINQAIEEAIIPVKLWLIERQLDNDTDVKPEYFETLAKQLNDKDAALGREGQFYSASNLYERFLKNGSNKLAFEKIVSEIGTKRRVEAVTKHQENIDYYKSLLRYFEKGLGKSQKTTITKDFAEKEIAKSARFISHESITRTFAISTNTKKYVEAYDKYFETGELEGFDARVKNYFSVVKMHEISQVDPSKSKRSLGEAKVMSNIQPDISDFFMSSAPKDAFETYLVQEHDLQVGRLSSRIAQGFYKLIAKAFGADLVIVASDNYKSRYIGESSIDGRSKIVINLRSGFSFHRVFAHELFHHVVNKATPAEYRAFKTAVYQIIGKTKGLDYYNTETVGRSLNLKVDRDGRYLLAEKDAGSSGITPKARSSFVQNARAQRKKMYQESVGKVAAAENVSRDVAEEEVLAELFTEVFSQKDFYVFLGKTFFGKTIAGKLLARLVDNVNKITNIKLNNKDGWTYEGHQLINSTEMESVYGLIGDMLSGGLRAHQMFPTLTNHNETRFHTTTIGASTIEEVNGYVDSPKKWLSGIWKTVFPPGAKSYKDVMTGIETIVKNTLEWLKEHKPHGIFAHFMADPAQMKIANKIAHLMELDLAKAHAKVVAKYPNAFKGMSKQQLEVLHDDFCRGHFYTQTAGNKTVRMQLKPINVGTQKNPNQEGIDAAKKLGYSDEIIAVFQEYKKVSDEIYTRLKEVYPNLPKSTTHYGQSIRWSQLNGVFEDDSFDAVLGEEMSRLEGNKRYTKGRRMDMTTAEIAEKNKLKYQAIDPHMMFLNYVKDTSKLIYFHEAINEGLKTIGADGKPIIKIFTNPAAAARAGYMPVDDSATSIMQKMNLSHGYMVKVSDGVFEKDGENPIIYSTSEEAQEAAIRLAQDAAIFGEEITPQVVKVNNVVKKTTSHWVVDSFDTDGNLVRDPKGRTYKTEAEAVDMVNRLKAKYPDYNYEATPVIVSANTGKVSQMYFQKDLARMMKIIVGRDYVRNAQAFGISGHNVMDVKNRMTSIEFALSMFHAMTIGQEMTASYASVAKKRGDFIGSIPLLNLRKANRESMQLATLIEAIIADEGLMKNDAVKRKAEELLGTSDPNVIDMIYQFYHAGGYLHQDTDLRSAVHSMGQMRYTNKKAFVKVVNGEAIIETPTIFNTNLSAISSSFKEVWDNQMAEHPDKKIKAAFNVGQFAVLQSTTAWLMEYMIPRVKMAMWMREYALKLDQNKDKLAAGLITKETIAFDTILFIEDRFGEVNWKNNWMKPSYKTLLQFTFRSFTWFTGSWKAFAKAGIDFGKLGWFTIKGEKYELTEKGMWGINAFLAHFMTVMLITTMYSIGAGDDEVPEDEETSLLTKMLFPRVDASDPEARVTVPSYITEGWKILHHLGIIGTEAEYWKLISGRTNSLVSNLADVWQNEDWRGVTIKNQNDNLFERTWDATAHIFGVLPISVSTAHKLYKEKGLYAWKPMALSGLGFTDAPAASKRSDATNKAFQIRRQEHKGKEVTADEMEDKIELRRAMYAYQQGDRTVIEKMLKDGVVSPRQFRNALSRIPFIGKKENPLYKDRLSQAVKGLTIKGALDVWVFMSDAEKKKHKPEIIKKYANMMSREDKPQEVKMEIKEQMKSLGIIR
jgi:hypothetical protein